MLKNKLLFDGPICDRNEEFKRMLFTISKQIELLLFLLFLNYEMLDGYSQCL